jgi:chromosome segregation ATPase
MEQREVEQIKAVLDASLDVKLTSVRRDINSLFDQKLTELRTDIDASLEKHLASVHEEISDFREDADRRFGKLDDRLTAVEGKLAGIDRRLDDELLRRNDLETRVRSVIPNLPPRPQMI